MFNLSLRKKLLLVSLLILLVPWVGIRYIQAIEDYLQQSLLDNLSHYTQLIATDLAAEVDLIPIFPSGEAVFALPLQKEVQLDGYDSDWAEYDDYRKGFLIDPKRSMTEVVDTTPTLLTGLFENSLYLYIAIPDQQIVYLKQNLNHIARDYKPENSITDSVQLILQSDNDKRELVIQTEAPGSVTVRDLHSGEWESRIKGVWRERDNAAGYKIELKIPMNYVSRGFNIVVNNSDGASKQVFQLSASDIIPVLSSPKKLTRLFSEFGMIPGRRIWLLDNDGRVLVKSGSLITKGELTPVNPLFAWLLKPQVIADPWKGRTRFERDDIQNALSGISDSRRLAGNNGENLILSSAWPVKKLDETVAVLFIEESTAAIQIMQRSALSELLNLSLLVFILLSIALIGFAGRLATRIRHLRDITVQSIDKHGRVVGEIPDIKDGDELDDLASHIREMLIRLRQYHDYLEKLSSRLSHELRTPIAVVRSSLENMQLTDLSADNVKTLGRADNGILRLQTILNRMSEASRLEQSIADSELEVFEFQDFLKNMQTGYEGVYKATSFNLFFDCGGGDCSELDYSKAQSTQIRASKDLLAQCLDKLVSNAVSFADPGTAIDIKATNKQQHWSLSVINQGPLLPENMGKQLFQSMVSVRDKKNGNEEPHMGLGLHIVRLIAEFHGGEVSAYNLENGVCITVQFPHIIT